MKTYEVVSHLTVKQWKKSWSQKVVEDTKKNVHDVYKNSCFLGHFENDNDFILYFHKEFEGNSLNTFFMGHVEKCKEGCRITGRFTKKKTANKTFRYEYSSKLYKTRKFTYTKRE